ncbi:MAG: hypothetical protein BGO26_12980 [Actinobacteria bacterium 69-20]|nr:cell wall-binding repeat-containing protein [Actinomycetota bacterium]OJV23595.1 MAG: hypothetical protein BGO26_12980 [Actinobacteria bacterium 69-20]
MRAAFAGRVLAVAAALVVGSGVLAAPVVVAAPVAAASGTAAARPGDAVPDPGGSGRIAMVDPYVPPIGAHGTQRAGAAADVVASAALPERIGGADRYATAGQIATQFGTADAVVVANGSTAKGGFDALAANYLAGEVHAPIVLTSGQTLEPTAAAAVRAVLTGSTDPAIYVMGGTDSVSDAVATALGSIAADVTGAPGEYVHRVAGDSRYATAALAAQAIDTAMPGTVNLGVSPSYSLTTAILASGAVNADALAAGPLSNAWGLPVLLTPDTSLPTAAADAIQALGIQQLIVLGGADRISDGVIAQAKSAGVQRVQRIAGANRFATAASLYSYARKTFTNADGVHYAAGTRAFLANGLTGFPDALAVGPLAGALGAPLLTVPAAAIDTSTLTSLAGAKGAITAVTVLGTAPTIGQAVLITAKAALSLNIAQTSAGTIADDAHARFLAAAAGLSTFTAKLTLAMTYLPHGGKEIASLDTNPAHGLDNAAGLTWFPTCTVWIDDTLPDNAILDILRHEYIHALQCRAANNGVTLGYASDDTAIGGIERGADAGAYLLGVNYMYYVDYAATATPLRVSEIANAQRLLALFKISYVVG